MLKHLNSIDCFYFCIIIFMHLNSTYVLNFTRYYYYCFWHSLYLQFYKGIWETFGVFWVDIIHLSFSTFASASYSSRIISDNNMFFLFKVLYMGYISCSCAYFYFLKNLCCSVWISSVCLSSISVILLFCY